MCLAVPSKVTAIDGMNATIEVYGTIREISLMLLADPPRIGEYVLVHAGFAIQIVDPQSSQESLRLFDEILAKTTPAPPDSVS